MTAGHTYSTIEQTDLIVLSLVALLRVRALFYFVCFVAVNHLRALLCSELRGLLVEPALLVILARLQGLSPWSCSEANESYTYSLHSTLTGDKLL